MNVAFLLSAHVHSSVLVCSNTIEKMFIFFPVFLQNYIVLYHPQLYIVLWCRLYKFIYPAFTHSKFLLEGFIKLQIDLSRVCDITVIIIIIIININNNNKIIIIITNNRHLWHWLSLNMLLYLTAYINTFFWWADGCHMQTFFMFHMILVILWGIRFQQIILSKINVFLNAAK